MTRPRPIANLLHSRWPTPLVLALLVLAYGAGAPLEAGAARQQAQANGMLAPTNKLYLENDDLELAVAESAGQQQFTSTTSHEILASGWPATSPMWPSIETDTTSPGSPQANTTTTPEPTSRPVEPFIYADKPSKQDYSLLLTLNKTLIEMLTNQQQARAPASVPLTVSLSFEYYLNHETRVAALPGIKIEVDRKEFDYLEPAAGGVGAGEKKPIKIRMWTRHSRQIALADAQHLDKPDWLKLSLVNRESPSLVAIRRLRVEFSIADTAQPPPQSQTPASTDESGGAGGAPPPAPVAPPPAQEAPPAVPSTAAQTQAPPVASDAVPPPNQAGPEAPAAAPPPGGEAEQLDPNQGGGAEQGPPAAEDQVPAASDAIASTIKPVSPKRKGWLPNILGGRRRRKRQAPAADGASAAAANATGMPLVLTCAQSDACEHWKAEPSAGQTQWSLARLPPSTDAITRGYYYVSNRLNYGDSSRPLLFWLNQTESATIVDQAADHCVDLALYVTERTRLKLYKAVRHNESSSGEIGHEAGDNNSQQWATWRKSALLITWAPTTISESPGGGERPHLAGGRLAATNQSGWTLETLCFGDFFERDRKCGLGECALAFEMSARDGGGDDEAQSLSLEPQPGDQLTDAASGNEVEPAAWTGPGEAVAAPTQDQTQPEQVVGVALLKQYAVSVPNRQARPPRWLETWQRGEVEPTDNWRLYPRADFDVRGDNVSLANLFTGAHYSLQSDWLQLAGSHLDFGASLLIELAGDDQNQTAPATSGGGGDKPQARDDSTAANGRVFSLRVKRRVVAQQNYETIYALNSTIDWYEHYNNATKLALFNLSLPNLSELIPEHLSPTKQQLPNSLYKMIIDIVLDCHWLTSQPAGAGNPEAESQKGVAPTGAAQPLFKLMLANVSLADRCFPSPCQFGGCQQNGTELEDWQCACDAQHRGRRCEFGRWCQLAHVAPPVQQPASGPGVGASSSSSSLANNLQLQQPSKKIKIDNNFQLVILKSTQPPEKQASGGGGGAQPSNKPAQNNNKATGESVTRVAGKEFCQRKLGAGSKCTEIDLALNDRLYFDENETFTCSCQDDYYLSDDSKCRQAHQCNSIVCPSIGQICDETRPFNRTQPCHCNEKQDWYPAPIEPGTTSNPTADKCIRRQCHDKRRDCGFDAHVCLPTLPGERPICKCGAKFTLKQHEKTGQKYCQSTACVLPTLNDCQHLCAPNDADLHRPYTCSCHEGYSLDKDGRTCKPAARQATAAAASGSKSSSRAGPHCKPACNKRTQVCTEFGCKCRQGYVPEGEIVVQVSAPPGSAARNGSSGLVNYVQSVRCLNVCSLSYAENKAEFERIESVCPLGLCEPSTFNCRCSDPNSSALVHFKYEPIWANESSTTGGDDDDDEFYPTTSSSPAEDLDGQEDEASQQAANKEAEQAAHKRRASALCHLKRVCQPDSASYQLCRARGAICVPDYTKPAMFDCICPPSSEKRAIGQAGDFNCEPRCSSIRQECLKKQAVCRPIDKDRVRCDCLPGMMLDRHDERCYLAHYSYAMNIIIVNKYYEPESRFHKLVGGGANETSAGHAHADSGPARADGAPAAANEHHQTAGAISHAELTNEALHQIVPQFQRAHSSSSSRQSMFILDYNQCNLTQLLPKSIIEDPYEHDMGTFLQYMDQCNEKIHQNARTYNLNSRLAEDLRQSMRQHLREFTVTTNNSLCQELPQTTMSTATDALHHSQVSYLNCTVYLQSMEPVEEATINHVFTNCDKHGADERFCWVKPRLLLMKKLPNLNEGAAQNRDSPGGGIAVNMTNPFQFRQIIPCEVNRFCGDDAHSLRLDERTSLCSCKCPPDIEMIDLKELEPRSRALVPFISASLPLGGATSATSPPPAPPPQHAWLPPAASANSLRGAAIKEICAPRDHCGANSTYCSFKTGSVCQYDIRTGSRCNCVYPSYENNEGLCVEITFSQLDSTLIVVIIMVGTCLIVSIALNLYALAKSRHGLFSAHKEYPLSEFTSATPSPVGRGGGGGSTVNISHRHPDDDEDEDEDAVSVNNRRHFTGSHQNNNNNNNNNRRNRSSGMGNRSTGMPNLAFDPND